MSTPTHEQVIVREVLEQFEGLVASLNALDDKAWAGFFSQNNFLSVVAGADVFSDRNSWVEFILKHFSMRASQEIKVLNVRVEPVAPGLAMLTSLEDGQVRLKDGSLHTFKHSFSMLWKIEPAGWRIIHSHESWADE